MNLTDDIMPTERDNTNIAETTSGGGVILSQRGRILLVRQHDGTWSLPKGHIEEGESPYQAALREIMEETGLTNLAFLGPIGRYQRYKETSRYGQPELKTIFLFLFLAESEGEIHPSADDIHEGRWEIANQASILLSYKEDRDFLENALRKIFMMASPFIAEEPE